MTQDEEEKALSRIIRFLDVVRVYAQDFPPFSDYGTDKPMHWKTKEIQELALSLFKGKCASEPVTWGVDWGKAGDIPCVSITKRLPNDVIELVAVEYAPYSYTTPPQRTWVGLTDEQKEALSQDAEGNPWAAVELAEAKLKELNT